MTTTANATDLYTEIEQRITDAMTARDEREKQKEAEQEAADRARKEDWQAKAAEILRDFAFSELNIIIDPEGDRFPIAAEGDVELRAWQPMIQVAPDTWEPNGHVQVWVLPKSHHIYGSSEKDLAKRLNQTRWKGLAWEAIGIVVHNWREGIEQERRSKHLAAAQKTQREFMPQWYHETGYDTVELSDLQIAHEAGAELKVIFQQDDGDYLVFVEKAAPSPAKS